ncbi:hypothetical protein GRI75_09450 [Altererythrobacter soli]|uniref:Bacterial HORMA domain-containing protein n=1 Tax=Croceibacterium soli TaxID=1739690 RepID=A0A6I4UY08_9SPHN|nr:hypothetical protein [Croceibacterium soli]MXP41865.1 hypothetical protein [Croceibacterium soli]
MNTATRTATYTEVDVVNVVRRVKADLIMIADSTGAITRDEASQYAKDIEVLLVSGYLRKVDLTLLSYGVEKTAVQYTVDTNTGLLTSSRPGGVLWPRVAGAYLRIILFYTDDYDDEARRKLSHRLEIAWSPTSADTSHSTLTPAGGRDYTSNSFGMQRKDWTQ